MDNKQMYEKLCQDEQKLLKELDAIRVLKNMYGLGTVASDTKKIITMVSDKMPAPHFVYNMIQTAKSAPFTLDIAQAWADYVGKNLKDGRSTADAAISYLKSKEFIIGNKTQNGKTQFKINPNKTYNMKA